MSEDFQQAIIWSTERRQFNTKGNKNLKQKSKNYKQILYQKLDLQMRKIKDSS